MPNQVVRVFPEKLPTMAAAVAGFLKTCAAKNLSRNTTDYYSCRPQAFRTFLEGDAAPDEVTADTVRRFLTFERERNSPTTAQHSHCAPRAFFAHLEAEGLLQENPMTRVEKPRRRKTVLPTLSMAQVEALLKTCGRDFLGVRDRAIILTLIDTGVRARELVTLTTRDVDMAGQTMLVLGKGDKERQVPFGSAVRQALTSCLVRRGELATDRLFVGHLGEPMTRHNVRWMLRVRGKAATRSSGRGGRGYRGVSDSAGLAGTGSRG